jgi:hypothetical protein
VYAVATMTSTNWRSMIVVASAPSTGALKAMIPPTSEPKTGAPMTTSTATSRPIDAAAPWRPGHRAATNAASRQAAAATIPNE